MAFSREHPGPREGRSHGCIVVGARGIVVDAAVGQSSRRPRRLPPSREYWGNPLKKPAAGYYRRRKGFATGWFSAGPHFAGEIFLNPIADDL